MLTTENNKVSLANQIESPTGHTWQFEVLRNGRLWIVRRTFEVDGTWRDRIRAKSNPAYAPHPTSPTAKAIGRMVTSYIDRLPD